MSESRSKKARLLIPLVLLVTVAGSGFAGYALAGGAPAAPDDPAVSEEPEAGEILEVGELTVSLAGPEAHYAKVGLAVVLAEGVPAEEVTDRFALLKDAALLALTERSADVLRTREGLEDLRSSLTRIARDIYPEGEVLRVVLTQAIVT